VEGAIACFRSLLGRRGRKKKKGKKRKERGADPLSLGFGTEGGQEGGRYPSSPFYLRAYRAC